VRAYGLILSQDVAVDRRGAPEAAQRHGAAQRERRVGGDAQEEAVCRGPGEGLCHLFAVRSVRVQRDAVGAAMAITSPAWSQWRFH